jgi:O-antigen/teichoic acid export membrane protein
MLASSLRVLQSQSGTILCGLWLGTDSAGLYACAARLSSLTLFGLQAVNTAAAPSFAACHAAGNRRQLQRLARIGAWASTSFAVAAGTLMVACGRSVLGLFGDRFTAAYPLLLIFVLGAAINATAGSVGHLLNMTGHQSVSLIVFAIGLLVYYLLSALLIPHFGLLGAAVASSMSVAAWNLIMVYFVRRRLGIWSTVGRLA